MVMPCSKYKGRQRAACYASQGWRYPVLNRKEYRKYALSGGSMEFDEWRSEMMRRRRRRR